MDRRRACRLGSYAYAETHGTHGCSDSGRIVRVGRSRVCEGLGVFAARYVPKCTPMTLYWGKEVPSLLDLTDAERAYAYELPRRDAYLIGERRLEHLVGRGVGQLLNDAIAVELTGRTNNCAFVHRRGRIFVVAIRNIAAGEELLADYHISYWIGMARAAPPPPLPPRVLRWAERQLAVETALRLVYGQQSSLDEYHGQVDGADDGVAMYSVVVPIGTPSVHREWGCTCSGPVVRCLVRWSDETACEADETACEADIAWRCASCTGMPAFKHLLTRHLSSCPDEE